MWKKKEENRVKIPVQSFRSSSSHRYSKYSTALEPRLAMAQISGSREKQGDGTLEKARPKTRKPRRKKRNITQRVTRNTPPIHVQNTFTVRIVSRNKGVRGQGARYSRVMGVVSQPSKQNVIDATFRRIQNQGTGTRENRRCNFSFLPFLFWNLLASDNPRLVHITLEHPAICLAR